MKSKTLTTGEELSTVGRVTEVILGITPIGVDDHDFGGGYPIEFEYLDDLE